MTVLTWIKIGLLKRGYNRAPDEKQQIQNEPPIIKQRGPQQGPYSTPSAVPPGQWPTEGPKPSKVAVILFYLSVVFTTLGILITIKMSFFEEVRNFIHFMYLKYDVPWYIPTYFKSWNNINISICIYSTLPVRTMKSSKQLATLWSSWVYFLLWLQTVSIIENVFSLRHICEEKQRNVVWMKIQGWKGISEMPICFSKLIKILVNLKV